MKLYVHSRTGCPHCDDAKAFLDSRGIPYTLIVHDDHGDRQELYDQLGLEGAARMVPQVVLHDGEDTHLIGGARELRLSGVESLFNPPGPLHASASPEAVGLPHGIAQAS